MNPALLACRRAAFIMTMAATLAAGSVRTNGAALAAKPAARPDVTFAIISDIHWHDVRLGASGPAYDAYIAQDPKLLRESDAILDSAINGIVQQHVKFVIVSGDLTKDGELVNHLGVAQHFAALERRGVQVFVVPGNHDINNPDAVRFTGATTHRVPSVSPQLFKAIYRPFGYGEAIEQDRHSLSYVAEPVKGVWLLAIDSCKVR